MRAMAFASRNHRELVRDPVTLLFGFAFPLGLLLIVTMVQHSIPAEVFRIESLAPGMAVLSLSFVSLFTGMLIAKDRSSSFLMRLFASPPSATEYITGYAVPLLPLAIAQGAVCFMAALILGLPMSANVLLAMVALIPSAVMFTGFGLLLGTLLTDKQVGPIASILVNVAALLGGTSFDLNAIGGTMRTISYALPFAHAVDATRSALNGDGAGLLPHLGWVTAYAVLLFAAAVVAFRSRMRSGEV